MNNTIEYKGYIGSIEFSPEDGVFFGKVQGVKALISYEGSNASDCKVRMPLILYLWTFQVGNT